MRCEWEKISIEDSAIEIIDGDRGKNYPNGTDFTREGFCLFLNAKNVTLNGFSFTEKMFISKEKDESLRKGKLKRKDVILTTRGTVGNVAYYNDIIEYNDIRINSGMLILRCVETAINANYVYWLFRSPTIQNQILSIKTGSAQPQLPITILKHMNFLLPPLPKQKAIAETLSCLDDKIELNNKINTNLEQTAQAIFKNWFVDFEPFKDGEFVESELGRIPEGWRVGELGELLSFVNGFAFKSSSYFNKGAYKIITIKNVQDGNIDSDGTNYIDSLPLGINPKCILSIGDVLLSLTGNVGRVGIVCENNLLLNQRVAKFEPHNLDSLPFFYFLFRQDSVKTHLENISKGTAQQNLSPVETLKTKIVYKDDFIDSFSKTVLPVFLNIIQNKVENMNLIMLRDTLLPKLMSGEIDVS